MLEYDVFIELLKKGESFLIASHFNPDGDGIGSTLAMGAFIERIGKRAVLYNRDRLLSSLAFLPGSEKIVSSIDPAAKFDMTIMVDCAQQKRISDEFASFAGKGRVACIDHHLLEAPEADSTLVDKDAASTGEVVLRLLRRARMEITPDVATCIYTTLVVDTGFFRYSNTNESIFALASELVSEGASPWLVAKHLEESYPLSRMRLLGRSLSSLELRHGGRYATMDVTQAMLGETGAAIEHSDEFAVYPRAIEGVEVSALFREIEPGRVKVSLRSKDTIDVAAIARGFGGGGHARAAGLMIKAPLVEAKARLDEIVAGEIVRAKI